MLDCYFGSNSNVLFSLLIFVLIGTDLASAKSTFMGFWVRDEVAQKPVISVSSVKIIKMNSLT